MTLAQSLWVSYDSLTVTDFCRNKNPHPPMEVVRQCIPALLALLQKGDNEIDGKQGSDLWLWFKGCPDSHKSCPPRINGSQEGFYQGFLWLVVALTSWWTKGLRSNS